MPQDQQQWMTTIISFGVLALVLTLRMRRARQVRPLKVERLWMLPAFYGVVVALLFVAHPPVGLVWLYSLLAFVLGLALGWYRGKLMTIHVDPETHALSQQGSWAAMLIIFVLVAVRYAARFYMTEGEGVDPDVLVSITDVLLAFGLGFIGAQRLEMGLRARALLAKAKGGA
ncbi:MAG: DUF1453 family protein [Sphingobium sp.]|nr:DUF1453 family protein [Sphingobium sp.]